MLDCRDKKRSRRQTRKKNPQNSQNEGQASEYEQEGINDTIGVALMTIGLILLFKNIHAQGVFYNRIVLPVSKASYGMYLGHMVALSAYSALFRPLIPSTPLVILLTAVCSFVTVAVAAVLIQRIPRIGKNIIG